MSWDIDSIKAERKPIVEEAFKDASREELLEAIVEREVALYPFARCLGCLSDKSWRGTYASSKLFPSGKTPGKFMVYNSETKQVEDVKVLESELHEVEYALRDSIDIMDGFAISDEFEILSVHQQAPGAYIGCGSVHMGDVRLAMKILNMENVNDDGRWSPR